MCRAASPMAADRFISQDRGFVVLVLLVRHTKYTATTLAMR